jgi:hypothetical protein
VIEYAIQPHVGRYGKELGQQMFRAKVVDKSLSRYIRLYVAKAHAYKREEAYERLSVYEEMGPRLLVEAGLASPNLVGLNRPAIWHACSAAALEVVEALINEGKDRPDFQFHAKPHQKPLPANVDLTMAFQALIRADAEPLQDRDTTIDQAITTALCDAGGDINMATPGGPVMEGNNHCPVQLSSPPLEAALSQSNIAAARMFVNSGSHITTEAVYFRDSILFAICKRWPECPLSVEGEVSRRYQWTELPSGHPLRWEWDRQPMPQELKMNDAMDWLIITLKPL